jgi:hypothetical protein
MEGAGTEDARVKLTFEKRRSDMLKGRLLKPSPDLHDGGLGMFSSACFQMIEAQAQPGPGTPVSLRPVSSSTLYCRRAKDGVSPYFRASILASFS